MINELGKRLRSKLQAIEHEREVQRRHAERTPDVLEQVAGLLQKGDNSNPTTDASIDIRWPRAGLILANRGGGK
jgi:hypothetical protein